MTEDNIQQSTNVGVTSVFVLAAIRRLRKRATGVNLAEATGLREAAVYNFTSRMAAKGLIQSTRVPGGSSTLYSLTPSGDEYLDHVRSMIR